MFSLVISSVVFLSLYFCSGPYDFFPSTNFGFCLFFLSIVSDLFFFFLILWKLVAQTVKCLPAMWESWVRSLGQEDALEMEMATHSGTLAWKIPWTEKPCRL